MKIFVSLFFVFLLSCGSKNAIPSGILPVPKMTDVLWDVMLADALATHRFPLDTVKRFDTNVVLYQQIAKAHGTTQQQFKQSLRFYEGRPDLLQIVIDSLQKRALAPIPGLQKDTLSKPTLFKKPTI
jgi:hypothetical protein